MHHCYQVIVNLFDGLKPLCIALPTKESSNVNDLKSLITLRLGFPGNIQRISTLGGRSLADEDAVFTDFHGPVIFNMSLRLLGGKGGFGSMLRAQGGRMNAQRTTNYEACRDLEGRRIRDVNAAKREEEEREASVKYEEEKRKRVDKKIEDALKAREPKQHRFDDNQFLEDKEQVVDGVKSAVDSILKRQKIKHTKSRTVSAAVFDDDLDEDDEDDDDEMEADEEDEEKESEKAPTKTSKKVPEKKSGKAVTKATAKTTAKAPASSGSKGKGKKTHGGEKRKHFDDDN